MKIRISLSLLFAISIFLISCGLDTKKNQGKSKRISINGNWASIGHGWILNISDSSTYSFYDITPISCLPQRQGEFHEIGESVLLQNDTLILDSEDITFYCIRTENLPKLCQEVLADKKAKDPLYNFDVFAETVKEHYAFLDLNQIDFEKLYKTQRGKLNPNASRAELYQVIEETFEKLNDNHAFLEATDEVYDELDDLFPEENDLNELPELGDFMVAKRVADHHMEKDLTKDSWLIHWGKMTKDIGYVQLKAMWLFADFDMSQELVDSLGFVDAYVSVREKMYLGEYMEKEAEGVNKIMDRVMKDLKDTKSIIIDIRFNGGGQDVVSMEILSHFCPNTILVGKHKFRYGNKHTPVASVFVEGSKNAYTNPVFVLTSPQTGSAAETFSLATLAMDKVKRIGSATEGALSSTLDKKLPIGWDFCISNEVYMDLNGRFYENEGIPADYELSYPRERQAFFRSVINDLDKDKADILKAIEHLENH